MQKHSLAGVQEKPLVEGSTPLAGPSETARFMALLCSCLGFALIILDANVINVALPALSHITGATPVTFLWFVNSYSLLFAAFLLTGGTLGDRLGARPVFLAGLLLFTLAAFAGSLAPRMEILLVARALQGVGAALLTPNSLSLLTHGYPDPQERVRAVSIYSALSGIGFVVGPLLGGMLLDTFGWRSAFLLSGVIGALALALSVRYTIPAPRSIGQRFDVPGQILAISALASLMYALIESKQMGWISVPVLASLGLFAIATPCFILIELRHKSPLLPLRLFTSFTFTVANASAFLYSFGLYGLLLMLALFLQNIQRLSALVNGLLLLPLSSTFLLTTWLIAGRVIARRGFRFSLMLGMASCCLGALVLIWITRGSGLFVLAGGLIAFGFGLGMIMPAMTAAVLASVDTTQAAMGAAVLNTSRQIGGVVGPVLVGLLVTAGAFEPGMQSALFLVSGSFFLVLMLIVCALPRARRIAS